MKPLVANAADAARLFERLHATPTMKKNAA
jgi:hypothetical protein